MSDDIGAAVINYRTPAMLAAAVRSFKKYYADVPLLIVDNGSGDESKETIDTLMRESNGTADALFLEKNIFHGPAMHRAMRASGKGIIFFFDSDTETRNGGFLEPMADGIRRTDRCYGAGNVAAVNKRGFRVTSGIPILLTPSFMIRRTMYLELPPFEHHGMPVLKNFAAAGQKGLTLFDYPVDKSVHHFGRGTSSRFGYGLGIKGKIDFLLNKFGL